MIRLVKTLSATLALTVVLYIAIPKGFFPVQDTGFIQGITRAAPEISFAAMSERQRELADAIRKDPDVVSLSSFIGVDGSNTTLNSGRILINLKPIEARKISASDVIRRLQPELASISPATGPWKRIVAAAALAAVCAGAWFYLHRPPKLAGKDTALKLAERAADSEQLVLGVDVNLSMLRVAASAIYRGIVQYPRRRTGVVYDRRRLSIDVARAEYIDFWACDVLALPFAENSFALATMLNVLDSVRVPRDLLAEAARVLKPDGKAIITSPYDWSPAVTPIEAWLGF